VGGLQGAGNGSVDQTTARKIGVGIVLILGIPIDCEGPVVHRSFPVEFEQGIEAIGIEPSTDEGAFSRNGSDIQPHRVLHLFPIEGRQLDLEIGKSLGRQMNGAFGRQQRIWILLGSEGGLSGSSSTGSGFADRGFSFSHF